MEWGESGPRDTWRQPEIGVAYIEYQPAEIENKLNNIQAVRICVTFLKPYPMIYMVRDLLKTKNMTRHKF